MTSFKFHEDKRCTIVANQSDNKFIAWTLAYQHLGNIWENQKIPQTRQPHRTKHRSSEIQMERINAQLACLLKKVTNESKNSGNNL
jgi:hypothetical protein